MEDDVIGRFFGAYRWLSNFWPCKVKFDGVTYPSVEHAYQAAKTTDPHVRALLLQVCSDKTPEASAALAKQTGNAFILRAGWDAKKLVIMENLLRQKFRISELRSKLLDTGTARLEEGNKWGDRFWGIAYPSGVGQNHLGKLLMKIRAAIALQDMMSTDC